MTHPIFEKIETLRQAQAYQNYLQVRGHVLAMLDQQPNQASDYWEEELAGFDYLFDASPLIVNKLREHSYHITGLRSYEYREHHSHQQPRFAKKLAALRGKDARGLFVPEAPDMGGFGHHIDGHTVNIDTLKFYEVLIALDKAGVLGPYLGPNPQQRLVIEIGAGWGGFAYQFKTLCPRATYILVDLPPTLLFSATYLTTLFPEARVAYGDDLDLSAGPDLAQYDFVFLPHYAFDQLALRDLFLAINMVSFQEMTTAQVSDYARGLAGMGCRHLYSLNRDRSRHNNQLSAVSSILADYYDLSPIEVLDLPYTTLEAKAPSQQSLKRSLKRIIRRSGAPQAKKIGVHDYQHLVGHLKQPELS